MTPFSLYTIVLVICCILIVSVSCFRFHMARLTAGEYVTGPRETTMRLFQMDNEADEPEPPTPHIVPPQKTLLLATFDNPAVVSPYRLNPSYRRPPGAESDHGYSTMTPHDQESEQRFNLELLREKRTLATSSQSATDVSRASSPSVVQTVTHIKSLARPRPAPGTTVLPNETQVPDDGAQLLAHVQVHMVDTR